MLEIFVGALRKNVLNLSLSQNLTYSIKQQWILVCFPPVRWPRFSFLIRFAIFVLTLEKEKKELFITQKLTNCSINFSSYPVLRRCTDVSLG